MPGGKKRKKRNSSQQSIDKTEKDLKKPKTTMDTEETATTTTFPSKDATLDDWGKFLYKEIQQLTKTQTNTNDRIDKILTEQKSNAEIIGKVGASIGKLIQENRFLKDQNKELNDRVTKLEYHTRRNNLLFDGFAETMNETDRDCYNKVRTAIANLYDDDENTDEGEGCTAYEKASRVVINRIHRLGKFIQGRTRSIIVNFQWYGDRQHIIEQRKRLPTGIYVNEDFPYEIVQRRNVLRPVLKQALKIPKYRGKVSLKYDKLIIYGKEYTMSNLDELPRDIKPSSACEKENDTHLGFFGIHSKYSNFHPCTFKVENKTYNCVEQFIQADKASSCDDDRANFRIMNTNDPREMKQIGSRLNNFIEQKWENERSQLAIYTAVYAKFSQNENLKTLLLNSGEKILFEACRDETWGCGVSFNHPGVLDTAQWRNQGGLMKDTLARVREELKPK